MSLPTSHLENLEVELKNIEKKTTEAPKVSVIVPAYNSEKHISKCLFSLIKQTLDDIEIIIVNDGSTDDTSKVISLFEKSDSRIKVIHQENQKQGSARNRGFEIAKGEYIGFVDSDDWVDLDFFEKLYLSAKKYNSDISLGTNVRTGGNKKNKKRLNITEEKFVTTIEEKFDIGKQAKNPCPTNKIYKSSFLKNNNIKWPEGVYCEDKLYTLQAVYYANGIVSVPNVCYYYFRNPNSTVNTKTQKHLKKLIEDKNNANRAVLSFLKEKNIQVGDKDFWAISKKIKFLGITLLVVKESIKTKKYLLFGFIKIKEN